MIKTQLRSKVTNDSMLKIMLALILSAAVATAATTAGTGAIFQPVWNLLSTILGDTFLGYIVAAISLIKAMMVFFQEGGVWNKIIMYVLAAGFMASLTTLAQTLAGATF